MGERNSTEKTFQGAGLIYGLLAFFTGYILTLGIIESTENFREIGFAGQVYYNAQFVDAQWTGTDALGRADSLTVNVLTDDTLLGLPIELQTPSIVYHSIPVLVLLIFGIFSAQTEGARTMLDGVGAGVSLVAGTLPAAIAGAFLFTFEEGGVQAQPILLDSIILVGALFPGVSGAIGGALGAAFNVSSKAKETDSLPSDSENPGENATVSQPPKNNKPQTTGNENEGERRSDMAKASNNGLPSLSENEQYKCLTCGRPFTKNVGAETHAQRKGHLKFEMQTDGSNPVVTFRDSGIAVYEGEVPPLSDGESYECIACGQSFQKAAGAEYHAQRKEHIGFEIQGD